MGILTDPWNLGLAGACASAYAWSKRAKVLDAFPTSIPIEDPVYTDEGVFGLGHYLPIEGEPEMAVWAPWDGGEQMAAILGTTGAGKTEAGKLIAATAAENWKWDVVAMDGAKDGLDFAFMEDSNIGRVVPGDDMAIELTALADEVERRGREFKKIRVKRLDTKGRAKAVPPKNLRFLKPHERERFGFKPVLALCDELAIALAREKATPTPRAKGGASAEPRAPIAAALLRLAAAGRYAGIHTVALMQRGDADIISGFLLNLFRARILVGATDQTAEAMAHGASTVNLWRELMEAGVGGWKPDGRERGMRPAGRAFVSGVARREAGLVQLYEWDSTSRFMDWDEHLERGGFDPDDPPAPPPPSGPSGPRPPSDGPSSPSLSLVPNASLDSTDTLGAARQDGGRESESSAPSGPRLRVV